MEIILFLFFAVIFWLTVAVVTAIVASSRGRSGFGWFLLSFFLLSFFALILVALLPSRKRDPSAPTAKTHVLCPDCREPVLNEARKCKHCGTTLIPQSEVAARVAAR